MLTIAFMLNKIYNKNMENMEGRSKETKEENKIDSEEFWENGNLLKRTFLNGTTEDYDKDGKIWSKTLLGDDGTIKTVKYYNDGTVECYDKNGIEKDTE